MPSPIPPTTSWYISIEINQTKWLQFKQDCGVSTAVRVYVYLGAFLNYFNHSLSGGLTAPPFSYVLVCGTIVLNSTQLNSFLLPFHLPHLLPQQISEPGENCKHAARQDIN